jgi:hypothetical protein
VLVFHLSLDLIPHGAAVAIVLACDGEPARLSAPSTAQLSVPGAMQHLQAAFVACVVVSITSMLAAPAMAGYSSFVFVPQADSPGNDYKRVGGLSFDECVNRCDADTACNAFTYNRLKQICFLKSAAAQWTIINLGAITGIRLSPFSLEGETPDESPVPDEKKQ